MVGLTATNALSEVFEVTSYRDGQMRMLQFKNGEKTIDTTTSIRDKKKHGLLVGFSPSKIFLGKSKLEVDELDEWLTKIIFSQDPKIKITVSIRPVGKEEQPIVKVYQNTTGIGGFLDKLVPEANYLKTPVILSGKTTIMENNIPIRSESGEINLVDMERDLSLDVVINFQPGLQETIKFSFCNDIENVEHGEHQNAVLNSLVTFFRKKVKEDSKKDDIEIVNNDILFGLVEMINMKTNYSTGLFTSQTKHKMDNRDFYEPLRKLTLTALDNYFKMPENKKVLTKIIAFIKENYRARMAASQSRKSNRKQKSFLESSIIAGYYPPNKIDNPGTHGCELYIVEGDSAGSNARSGRVDPDVQGVLGLGGKPTNGFKVSDDKNIEKVAPDIYEFFNNILGCGMGKNFNINDCRYKRIIIASDSDVDGGHICGLIVANIYKYARPLLDAGMVYRIITPLYMLKPAKETNKIDRSLYLYNKSQYFDVYEKIAYDVYKIKIDLNDEKYVSKQAMVKFLEVNSEYYKIIDTIAKQSFTSPDIIEYLAVHLNDYKTSINKDFEELDYIKKDRAIKGTYAGTFHYFLIDEDLLKSLHYLHEVIGIANEGHSHYYLYKTYKSKNEDMFLGYQSIYNIMNHCQDLQPDLESRFKGLGELDALEFKLLAMDPNFRTLMRISILDAESTEEVMENLFSDSRQAARKKMIEDADISVEDIDN